MASKMAKAPLLRAVSTRGFSNLAPVCGNPNYDLKTTTLPNKMVVAAAETDSPIARVSIVFRAGSRNEASDDLGATHVLRTAAGLSTKNASQFAIIRNIQQVGASLTATSDREVISYTLEGTVSAVKKSLPFLSAVATQQLFRPWEVAELSPRLHLDIATRPLQLRAVDLLHNAAFRTGLGNSLFIPKSQIGKISSETLQHYVGCNFVSGRAAVVGLGMCEAELKGFAQSLQVSDGEGSSRQSPYKGGELRSNKGGDWAYIAVAGEGASLKNTKEALAFAVLKHAVGAGPLVPFSNIDNGLLSKEIGTMPEAYSSTAINASYSDTGIFGVLIAAPAFSAGQLVEKAVTFMKCASISDKDVARGKNQLKAHLLLEAESGGNAIYEIGRLAAITGSAQSATQIATAVDAVSLSDVDNAFRKAGKKISMASIGNLSNVPYLDELK